MQKKNNLMFLTSIFKMELVQVQWPKLALEKRGNASFVEAS
jgi:hypothetical protein